MGKTLRSSFLARNELAANSFPASLKYGPRIIYVFYARIFLLLEVIITSFFDKLCVLISCVPGIVAILNKDFKALIFLHLWLCPNNGSVDIFVKIIAQA
jgi:hypothetical protein